jgi:hypothetical protein
VLFILVCPKKAVILGENRLLGRVRRLVLEVSLMPDSVLSVDALEAWLAEEAANPRYQTFEEWKASFDRQWPELWSNYVNRRDDVPSEEQLREWYWLEVGRYKPTRRGIGSL